MIKSIYSLFLLTLFLVSCAGESSSGKTSASITGSFKAEDLVQLKQEFIECKEHNTQAHSCKEYVAKSIGRYYGYEFMGANEQFLPYDKLPEVVAASPTWKEIGVADQQTTLTSAQENANKGIPTLALNPNSNTVAIVIKGKLTHSNSLGLDCPAVAVLRPKRFEKSFVGKGINYAWSDLSGVKIFSLK